MRSGAAFLPAGAAARRDHRPAERGAWLSVVCLEPHGSDRDESCVSLPGGPPDVREDCTVRYSRATYVSELDLRRGGGVAC